MSPRYSIETGGCTQIDGRLAFLSDKQGESSLFETPDETGEYTTGLQNPRHPIRIRQNLDRLGVETAIKDGAPAFTSPDVKTASSVIEDRIKATLIYQDERTVDVEIGLSLEGWGISEELDVHGESYRLRVATYSPIREIAARRNSRAGREVRGQTRGRS
jgi:hypothetical protein